MKKLKEQEQQLLDIAHQILAEDRRLMLPHHQDLIGPRLETFDEVQINEVNVLGINAGRYKTNIQFLTHPHQRVTITPEMSRQDTVIIDLSAQQPDLEQMRRFLLTTEDCRTWHHAPWIVINIIKRQGFRH